MTSGAGMALAVSIALLLLVLGSIGGTPGMQARDRWSMWAAGFGRRRKRR